MCRVLVCVCVHNIYVFAIIINIIVRMCSATQQQ